jgi:hypothetical protein
MSPEEWRRDEAHDQGEKLIGECCDVVGDMWRCCVSFRTRMVGALRVTRMGVRGTETARRMTTLDFKSQIFQVPESPNRHLKLREQNSHPKDSFVHFDSSSHTYFVDEQPIENSVTQVIEKYFEQFDSDAAISSMQSGPNWPRPEYIDQRNNQPYTPEQIKKKWNDMGTYSRNRGTWLHYNLESYLNGNELSDGPYDPTLITEMKQFHDFEKKEILENKITPYRTEWAIGSSELQLAGTVDFVGRLPNGKYVLMDWKRSMKLSSSMTNTWRNAK